jgi:alpha-glucosidase (family GH31 glycosyl hydrolase)
MAEYRIEENKVYYKNTKISIITDRLIRFEYSKDNNFVDSKTQMVVNREYLKNNYQIEQVNEFIKITTDELIVECNGNDFSKAGLNVILKKPLVDSGQSWRYGDKFETFGGTARTLDTIDGECELEAGIFSKYGYSIIDDTDSMLLTDDGFVKPRKKGNKDIYFFGYGRDFKQGLKDFYSLTGKQPLIPRYALGNWWSRYYKYTAESYLSLMDEFANHNVPLSVSVIDMDWHYVDLDEKFGSGWTGYSWNKEFFPNPKGFLDELHNRGLKVTINDHPADGVKSFEDNYKSLAKSMGIDPKTEQIVLFDASNKKYLDNLQKHILEPLENEGIDFWWIDWQQGSISKVEGLDPLLALNVSRFVANQKDNNRPLIFSRYAGPGSHRYPVGFSGDTVITWDSLKFQPKFTACASNIGFGWWSHDIGGHMQGIKDNDLELRWYQYGVFSPINRLHSSNSVFTSKEPWRYERETSRIMCKYLRLRHQMIPYLYTMAYRAYKDDMPLVEPMYYENANIEEAYNVDNQYYFGANMIVAPIVQQQVKSLLMGKTKVYLPDSTYYDFFSSRRYSGNRTMMMYRSLEEMPVLIKMGDIIPLTDEKTADVNPSSFEIKCYMGCDGTFNLYEDDNKTSAYIDGIKATTLFKNDWEKKKFVVNKVKGNLSLVPERRDYKLIFIGIDECDIAVAVDGSYIDVDYSYDKERCELIVEVKNISTSSELIINFPFDLELVSRNKIKDLFELIDRFEIEINLKEKIYSALNNTSLINSISILNTLNLDKDLYDCVSEILLA